MYQSDRFVYCLSVTAHCPIRIRKTTTYKALSASFMNIPVSKSKGGGRRTGRGNQTLVVIRTCYPGSNICGWMQMHERFDLLITNTHSHTCTHARARTHTHTHTHTYTHTNIHTHTHTHTYTHTHTHTQTHTHTNTHTHTHKHSVHLPKSR